MSQNRTEPVRGIQHPLLMKRANIDQYVNTYFNHVLAIYKKLQIEQENGSNSMHGDSLKLATIS